MNKRDLESMYKEAEKAMLKTIISIDTSNGRLDAFKEYFYSDTLTLNISSQAAGFVKFKNDSLYFKVSFKDKKAVFDIPYDLILDVFTE